MNFFAITSIAPSVYNVNLPIAHPGANNSAFKCSGVTISTPLTFAAALFKSHFLLTTNKTDFLTL